MTIPATSAGILPGMKVQADISISQDPHWIVPRSAVLHDGKGDYLYQIEGAHARRVDVRTMVDNGAVMGVDGPLKSTLGVVSVGNYELQPGTPVRAATGATR